MGFESDFGLVVFYFHFWEVSVGAKWFGKLMFMMMLIAGFAVVDHMEPAFAGEKGGSGKKASADMAYMEKAMKAGQPSEAHKELEWFVGNWTHDVEWWMGEKTESQKMTGKTVSKLIYDGRFLHSTVTGDAVPDQPQFEGMGIMGYNNTGKHYTTFWIDNMSTASMTGKASFNAKKKSFKEEGNFTCPMTDDTERPFRATIKRKGKNKYTYSMYMTDPMTKKEYKAMHIVYKRDTK